MLNSYYLIFWIGEVANHSTKYCINLNLLNLILVRNRLRIYLIFWIPRMRIQIISNTFKLMINSPILLEWKRDKLTLRCTKKRQFLRFSKMDLNSNPSVGLMTICKKFKGFKGKVTCFVSWKTAGCSANTEI